MIIDRKSGGAGKSGVGRGGLGGGRELIRKKYNDARV